MLEAGSEAGCALLEEHAGHLSEPSEHQMAERDDRRRRAAERARRAERLHGRLEKKFEFMKVNADRWGCGRCIEACAGGIDVRQTLKELLRG